MSNDDRLAGVVMFLVGAPLVLLGLVLGTDANLLLTVALFAGITVALAALRVLRRRPRTAEGSPWWNLLVLVLVPLGFLAELGPSAMLMVGGLLLADGLEHLGQARRGRRAAGLA
ncbi:hypothetical protein C8N24_1504 [Solirubrobacter pauli]|uniref:Uncharacterized protein n=1 Tax=Solirubrobacter pauli TaxID=166793 RepID=A0A660L9I9_9ACTN|nr:hypothetical protein [Solirubrobacter pauli]RKQ91678.1 hypothetical protein C8N24_1504 [Solirubrobacter pauli]